MSMQLTATNEKPTAIWEDLGAFLHRLRRGKPRMRLASARHCIASLLGLVIFGFAFVLHAIDAGGIITTNTVWTSALPIHVTTNVTVPTNITLTIQAGALVQLGRNISIVAQDGGAIDVAGTIREPVLFRSLDGTNNWRRIGADGTNATLTMRHADIEHGQTAVLNAASGLFEMCYFHDYDVTGFPTIYNQPILVTESAPSLIVRACHFRNYYEALFRSGVIVIEDSLFEDIVGDGIDFDTAAPGSVIRRCTIRHGTLPNVDAVDLGSQSIGVLVENCLMYDFPFDKGVSIGEGSSDITVRSCVIYGVDTGIAVKDSSAAAIVNNTIADSNYALRLYEKNDGQGGGQAVAWNNILWSNTNSISLLNLSTIALSYSDVAGASLYPGTGNISANPMFLDAAAHDYRLATTSPAIGSGTNGATLGALFPIGSFLVDTDGDGLPDTWELTYDMDFNNPADAAADPDADGLSNLQEYLAGTNPRIASSVLKASLRTNSNGARLLEFSAAANKSYTIEYRDSLGIGAWAKLAEIDGVPSERVQQWPIDLSRPMRLFRILVSQPH